MSQEQRENDNKVMTKKLLVVVIIMVAFGFAMVPLYDVFCQITGLNGKVNGLAVYEEQEPDMSREIKIQFMTINKGDMPWDFRPVQTEIMVNPGKEYEVLFAVKNRTGKRMIGQAIPSFSPNLTAQYFNKTECFCFNQQTLAAGESEEMPMRFFVDKDIPKRYDTITLAYTLHNVTPDDKQLQAAK